MAPKAATVTVEEDDSRHGAPLPVRYSRIVPNPDQPRKWFDPDSVEQLSYDIEENGQKRPVKLCTHPDPKQKGYFMLVGGERRWRAFGLIRERKLNDPIVEAYIVVVKTPDELFDEAFSDNCGHEGMDTLDEAAGLDRMFQRGRSLKVLANMMQKSENWVRDHIRLNGLPDEVKQLMHPSRAKEDQLGVTIAIELSYLPKSEKALMIEIANESVERRLSLSDAQFMIETRTGRPGVQGKGRSGRDMYRSFNAFVTTTESKLDSLLRDTNFNVVYRGSSQNRKDLDVARLDDTLKKLTQLRENVAKAKLI